MTERRGVCLFLFIVGLTAGPAGAAFWNRRSEAPEPAPAVIPASSSVRPAAADPASTPARQLHRSIEDEAQRQALFSLANQRTLREEELRVLERLLNEKAAELQRLDAGLEERFGVAPDKSYQYDEAENAIYELSGLEEAAEGRSDTSVTRTLHRRLGDAAAAESFLKQVGAKNITAAEIQYLRLIHKEKQLEVERVYTQLEERFGILRDKHYEYDAEEEALFEMPPAGDGNAPDLP